jgi:hypothetical protein
VAAPLGSIPDIAFIVVDAVFPEEVAVFVLKGPRAVVLERDCGMVALE